MDDDENRGDGPLAALDPTGILTELTLALQSPASFEAAMNEVVTLAERRIPGVGAASITLIDDGAGTVASTETLATELDERQYSAGWGPCLYAGEFGQLARMDDSANETRWPDFAEAAVAAGVGSSLSAPLPSQQHISGALNLYAYEPHAFDEPSSRLAESFAAHVALMLAQAFNYTDASRQAATLQEAMHSRAVIEQAKGILMAARECGADEAFDILVRQSQTRHVKLRDVAAQLVAQASGHPTTFDGV
jgi:GAF domain-containing protein